MEGMRVNVCTTRWIIGSVAAALWALTVITATVNIHVRWYLAIWLGAFIASLGVLACLVDAMARVREARRHAAGRVALDQSVEAVCAALDKHADRMERSVNSHGRRMESSVFTAERWQANGRRGEILAQIDAAQAVATQRGDETGPLPAIFGGAR
jgi:hypothetical protein